MPRDKGGRDRTKVPRTIRQSDRQAQLIWKKTHDSAVETYGEGSRAHRVAFASLKHQYRKEGDRWVPKGWRGPSDPQAARGATTRRRSTAKPAAPTAGGKIARTVGEAGAKAHEARREYGREYRRHDTGRRRAAKTGTKAKARKTASRTSASRRRRAAKRAA
ncbi:MAG: ChaB family protein [Candidatus Rokubacteria bacterium]|nr:ChaB family protein [Candidatus Rokubacteria bacterium]